MEINDLHILIQYRKLAHFRRGEIIDRSIKIERLIDNFITNYFVERNELKSVFKLVITQKYNISFSKKSDILFDLLKLEFPKIKEAINKLQEDIQEIIKIRNKLAHVSICEKNAVNNFKKLHTVFTEEVVLKKQQAYRITEKEYNKNIKNMENVFLKLNAFNEGLKKTRLTPLDKSSNH